MEAPIIDDELWTLIEPLLPPPKPRRESILVAHAYRIGRR
jgi:transposase